MESIKEYEGLEPVSPFGQYFNSKVLSVSIFGILEFEMPIDDFQITSLIKSVFLPINPRFSSIMVTGRKGERKWKKVEVNVENHMHVRSFSSPKGSSSPSGNDVKSYISQIAMKPFPQGQPLWEVHIINCPTSEAQGTIIFKLHHALGDGYTLVGTLLSCLQRADDPSLPVTLPSVGKDDSGVGLRRAVSKCFSLLTDTVRDFSWSVLKSTYAEDDLSPIRSGSESFRPSSVSMIAFSLDHIKEIKSRLGATINDVITGIVFLGTRLYMQRAGPNSGLSTDSTALVMLNTRNLRDYKSVSEMLQPNSKSPWGNYFAFLHVPIPKVQPSDSQFSDPLSFVRQVREVIKRKRSSLGVVLTGMLLETMKKCRNPEVVARHIHRTIRNSSMIISNVMGPREKLALANYPVKGIYFTVSGTPESLQVTMISYAGNLNIIVRTEQGFVDSELYTRSLLDAFDMVRHDACGKQ